MTKDKVDTIWSIAGGIAYLVICLIGLGIGGYYENGLQLFFEFALGVGAWVAAILIDKAGTLN